MYQCKCERKLCVRVCQQMSLTVSKIIKWRSRMLSASVKLSKEAIIGRALFGDIKPQLNSPIEAVLAAAGLKAP